MWYCVISQGEYLEQPAYRPSRQLTWLLSSDQDVKYWSPCIWHTLPAWYSKRRIDIHFDSWYRHFLKCTTLRLRQNGRRFEDDTFKCIILNENVRISIKISLKFVPKGPINNNPALVQIMAWRGSGDKPLSEPMMVSLIMHICVTPPQWLN